jgi:hypothetical protein
LEAGVRSRIRGFIEELLEAELDGALSRRRYRRLDRRIGLVRRLFAGIVTATVSGN